MLSHEKNNVPANFKVWLGDTRENLAVNQHYTPPNSEKKRSNFATFQGIGKIERDSRDHT